VRGLFILYCLAAVLAVGCALSRDGNLAKSCTADAECQPADSCMVGTCTDNGLCDVEALPDGPTPMQEVGNCQLEQCVDGTTVLVADDADVLASLECEVNYLCLDGVPQELIIAEKAACTDANGLPGFCENMACVPGCTEDNMCNGTNPCVTGSCNAATNECEFVDLDNVPSPNEADGDCQITLCVVGMETSINNDTDVPIDGNPCTADLCNQGVPSNPDEPIGLGCSGAGDVQVCDGGGACVECNGVSDCVSLLPISEPDCASRQCNAGLCQYNFATVNTPLNAAQQTTGNCKLRVCDGAGNEAAPNNDNGDTPVDGNLCTSDVCTNGVPSNPGLPINTSCGGALVCSGPAGMPQANQCQGCTNAGQCGAGTECFSWSCNSGNCNQVNDPSGTVTSNQVGQDCLQEQCDGNGGETQVAIFDPIIDGNTCTADLCDAGTPSNPNRPLNFACPGSNFCDGLGACVQCNDNTQCNGGDDICESDDCVAKSCMIVFATAGTPAPPAQQATGDCQLAVCLNNGTVNPTTQDDNGDPFIDGVECTTDLCAVGVPENDPKPSGTTCATGFCDGMTSCVECTDDSHCNVGIEQCDLGSFTCKFINGETCSDGATCFSGNCVDGYCCNTSCTAGCQACDVGGSQGTCTNEPSGTSEPATCPGTACDGSGGCLLADGGMCTLANECFNNFCEDTVCCENSCAGDCRGCNTTTPGSCEFHATGTDLDADCATVGESCDGSGTCSCGNDIAAVGGSCPGAVCNAGCVGTTCNITCADNSCGTINCPAGWDCNLVCPNVDSCRNSTLNCPANESCTVTCADQNDACRNMNLNCGAEGTCNLLCNDNTATDVCRDLTVTCGNDACVSNCTGTPSGYSFTAGASCNPADGC
jgi:hypothetical protein